MPLQLNLLHEEIFEQRQRQRDPLKLSMYAAVGIAALLAFNYLWSGYRVLNIKGRLSSAQREWERSEPKLAAAQKRADELNSIISTTNALDNQIDGRFLWAPILEKIARCVTPNIQITNLDGVIVGEEKKAVTVTLDGVAGGREPRGVAEDFRQMLLEQIGKNQPGIKVEFKALEDLESVVSIDGNSVPMARFVVAIIFDVSPKPAATPAADRKGRAKKGESRDE